MRASEQNVPGGTEDVSTPLSRGYSYRTPYNYDLTTINYDLRHNVVFRTRYICGLKSYNDMTHNHMHAITT